MNILRASMIKLFGTALGKDIVKDYANTLKQNSKLKKRISYLEWRLEKQEEFNDIAREVIEDFKGQIK